MKPGQRQIQSGREWKQNTGSSPNGVGNAWLSKRRGQNICVKCCGVEIAAGELSAFDAYCMEVSGQLVMKGPGVVVVDA